MSSHSFCVQTARYGANRLHRNRICIFCDHNDIDDEFHFICKCPCFDDIRKIYINRYYYIRPNMHKFIELLNSKDKDLLLKFCKFCKIAFSRRLVLVNNN